MIRSKTKLPGLRCFIGVGSRDFALAGARALQRAALAAGVAEVEWREYQEVGHVLILQDAIPDVFEWLDR